MINSIFFVLLTAGLIVVTISIFSGDNWIGSVMIVMTFFMGYQMLMPQLCESLNMSITQNTKMNVSVETGMFSFLGCGLNNNVEHAYVLNETEKSRIINYNKQVEENAKIDYKKLEVKWP